jgi:hypothetical protein
MLAASSSFAAPPTKQECIFANEDGQDLRRAGRIRSAIELFELCSVTACPGPLREDCVRRLAEATQAQPTIVFSAKDAEGKELTEVKVTMDDSPLAERLDGAPLRVDPGEHGFEFTAVGFEPTTMKLVVLQGAKLKPEAVVLALAKPSSPTVRPSPVDEPETASDGSTQRTLGYVAGGMGVVAVGFGVAFGLSANANHSKALASCPEPARCPKPDAVDEGNRARDQALIANVGYIASAALLAGGIILYLTAPKRTRAVLALTGTRLGVGGTW